MGMGEGLAAHLAALNERPGEDVSVLLACLAHDVPVTVHTAIGAEIIHQHPAADGAAMGATSQRDFLRLAGSLPAIDQGGVVMNWGSAVIMPEVFLKALTDRAESRWREADALPGGRLRHAAALSSADERGAAPDPGRRHRAFRSPGITS